MKLGFIGTGNISSDVITGICKSNLKFKQIMISPRIHVDIGKSSSISLIEHHIGLGSGNFSNSTTIFSLKENSHCKHIRLQKDSDQAINAGNIHLEQEKYS